MLHIYDSLSGEKRPFHKQNKEKVSIYVCGPTVYDYAHLGHGRSAVAFDLLRRSLIFLGHEVTFAFNMTDIDDKMIKRAAENNITVKELATDFIAKYEEDYAALGILPPTHQPNATDYVQQMVELVQKLEEKGHTYNLEDGVYFDITTFKEYGKLSHQKLDELQAGARVAEHKGKRNHQDFVLWKFKKEGEPFWSSPWGEGRPGWHIECSAMSNEILGNPFDIHGGGLDLKFPHHECEIAQSEGATGEKTCEFWMHNGYITVNKEKMSKSLNNFFTLRDIFKKHAPRVVRFFLAGSHYRSPIEYNTELLDQAKNTLKSIDDFYLSRKNHSASQNSEQSAQTVSPASENTNLDESLIQAFTAKIENDIDVAGALGVTFEWMNGKDQNKLSTKSQEEIAEELASLERINTVLNILPLDFKLTPEQENLITERNQARQNKDWAKADEIRDALSAQKIELVDDPSGTWAKPLL
jgi:cysteinyl-tRNA synthetase